MGWLDVAKIVPPSNDPWLLVRLHLEWMAFNSMLGVIPFVLGRWLTRSGARTTVTWIFGAVAFLFWMPNLAYLLTDVVHVPEAVGDSPDTRIAVIAFVPGFTIFTAAALVGFVDVIRRVRHHVVGQLSLDGHHALRAARVIDAGLCLIAGCGVVVGRVTHFQTWDLVRAPFRVVTISVTTLASVDRALMATLAAALLLIPVRLFQGDSVVLRPFRATTDHGCRAGSDPRDVT